MTAWSEMLAMAGPGGGAQNQGSALGMFLPMIIIFAIFYFMLIRPQQRKEKERKQMIDNLKMGDRIIFGGGFVGTVTSLRASVLGVRIAEDVKVEILRSSVTRLVDKDDKDIAGE